MGNFEDALISAAGDLRQAELMNDTHAAMAAQQNIQSLQSHQNQQQTYQQNMSGFQGIFKHVYADKLADFLPDPKELAKKDKYLKDKVLLQVVGVLCQSESFAKVDLKELKKLADEIVLKLHKHFKIDELPTDLETEKIFNPSPDDATPWTGTSGWGTTSWGNRATQISSIPNT